MRRAQWCRGAVRACQPGAHMQRTRQEDASMRKVSPRSISPHSWMQLQGAYIRHVRNPRRIPQSDVAIEQTRSVKHYTRVSSACNVPRAEARAEAFSGGEGTTHVHHPSRIPQSDVAVECTSGIKHRLHSCHGSRVPSCKPSTALQGTF